MTYIKKTLRFIVSVECLSKILYKLYLPVVKLRSVGTERSVDTSRIADESPARAPYTMVCCALGQLTFDGFELPAYSWNVVLLLP